MNRCGLCGAKVPGMPDVPSAHHEPSCSRYLEMVRVGARTRPMLDHDGRNEKEVAVVRALGTFRDAHGEVVAEMLFDHELHAEVGDLVVLERRVDGKTYSVVRVERRMFERQRGEATSALVQFVDYEEVVSAPTRKLHRSKKRTR